METLLAVNDLTIRYTDGEPVVRNIQFSIDRGESVLLAGASGSGKSTLALALAGLIPRAVEAEITGSILWKGDIPIGELPATEACRRIGMVFQDPDAQFCMLTPEEEIAFALENIDTPRKQMEEKIQCALAAVGMEGYRQTRIDRLSGGCKQRLALSCILAQEPEILILDEPTANLDPEATISFFALLQEMIRAKRHSVILIEHKLEIPASFVDKMMVLTHGALTVFDDTKSVLAVQGEKMKNLGVWQPYSAEIAQALQQDGVVFLSYPLTIPELCTAAQEQQGLAEKVKDQVLLQRKAIKPRGQELDCLVFDNVSFSYKTGFGASHALKDISLKLKQGSFTVLLGGNGAGKSTLARLSLGLLRPDEGRIFFSDQLLDQMPRKTLARQAGLVFQNPEHQFITDTVWDELAWSVRMSGANEGDMNQRIQDLLFEFQLIHRAEANPFALSQGEKRRLSAAVMLAADQKLLLLDELTFGQDCINTYRLMEMVKRRCEAGCTIFMLTHDMRLAWEYATNVAVLCQGRMVYNGEAGDFFSLGRGIEQWSLHLPPALQVLQGLRGSEEGLDVSVL